MRVLVLMPACPPGTALVVLPGPACLRACMHASALCVIEHERVQPCAALCMLSTGHASEAMPCLALWGTAVAAAWPARRLINWLAGLVVSAAGRPMSGCVSKPSHARSSRFHVHVCLPLPACQHGMVGYGALAMSYDG